MNRWKGVLAAAVLPGVGSACAFAGQVEPPRMHASVTAVAPGATFDVAFRFTLGKGQYLYWSNPGSDGHPPSVRWELPEGWSVEPLQFPVPKRVATETGGQANVLAGRPVLLVGMTAPTRRPTGSSVSLRAHLRWETGGIDPQSRESTLQVTLPIVDSQADVAPPENEVIKLFDRARRRLPQEGRTTKYIKLAVSPQADAVVPGDSTDLRLTIDVQPGFHIQSNAPLLPGLIATTVFTARNDDLTVGAPVFPQPHIRELKGVGKLSEFVGQTVVRIPTTVRDEVAASEVSLDGLLTFQACDDKSGRCFAPETVTWSATIAVKH